MKQRGPFILLSSIIVLLASCHKFANPDVNGTFSWTENNKEYTATSFAGSNKIHSDSDITIAAWSADNHHGLSIHLQNVFTPGTYHIGFNIVSMSYSYGNTAQSINNVILTISELTKQKISGSFTAKTDVSNDSVNITGYFDLKFP